MGEGAPRMKIKMGGERGGGAREQGWSGSTGTRRPPNKQKEHCSRSSRQRGKKNGGNSGEVPSSCLSLSHTTTPPTIAVRRSSTHQSRTDQVKPGQTTPQPSRRPCAMQLTTHTRTLLDVANREVRRAVKAQHPSFAVPYLGTPSHPAILYPRGGKMGTSLGVCRWGCTSPPSAV